MHYYFFSATQAAIIREDRGTSTWIVRDDRRVPFSVSNTSGTPPNWPDAVLVCTAPDPLKVYVHIDDFGVYRRHWREAEDRRRDLSAKWRRKVSERARPAHRC